MPPNGSDNKLNADLKKLDNDLDILRREYEKFFRGARDRPPNNKRKKVERQIRDLEKTKFTNTSMKFRFRSLQQRYNTYKQKWNRIQRQKERGTYEPDKKKAERRRKRQEEQEPQNQEEQDEPDEAEPSQGVKQNEDGSFELELGDDGMDLESFERELEEMDKKGEFEKYVETAKLDNSALPEEQGQRTSEPKQQEEQSQSSQDDGKGETPQSKKDRIRSLQDELGLSSGSGGAKSSSSSGSDGDREDLSERRDKLDEMRRNIERGGDDESSDGKTSHTSDSSGGSTDRDSFERQKTERVDRANPDAPSRGAKPEQLQELIEKRRRQQQSSQENRGAERESSDSGSGQRSSSRSDDDSSSDSSGDDDEETQARKVYERLIRAKEELGEETDHLDFDKVRTSMIKQAVRLREETGAESVSFQVVKKDGRAFLKPTVDD